jgi:hypothetical protein
MKIIEFFGLPFSGKTHQEKNLYKIINKKKIYNYNTIFIYYLFKTKKISLTLYFIIKYYLYKKNFTKKKKFYENSKSLKTTFFKKIKRKILLKFTVKIFRQKNIYYEKNKKNYLPFVKLIDNLIKHQPISRVKKLRRWIIDQIVGYDIAKKDKSKNLLVNSEGFMQRLLSINLYSNKIDIKKNYKILQKIPKSDYFIYIKENNREIITRMKKLNYQNSIYYKKIDNLNLVLNEIQRYMIKNNFTILNKENFSKFFKNKF